MINHITPLTQRDSELTEGLYCAEVAGGKLIHHSDMGSLADADDVLIIQHGLAGVKWRKSAEEKVRELVKKRHEIAVILGIPSGIKADQDNLGIGESDLEKIKSEFPQLFNSFTLKKYLNGLFELTKYVRQNIREDCRLHLAGQSYGAIALLYALRRMAEMKMSPPSSASFMTPFVKISLDNNPEIDLTISNPDEKLDKTGRTERLKRVLAECHDFYNVPDDVDLFREHGRIFDIALFEWIGSLRDFCSTVRTQVVRGEKDPYISDAHSRLISDRIKVEKETTLPHDGHDLESLDFEKLVGE